MNITDIHNELNSILDYSKMAAVVDIDWLFQSIKDEMKSIKKYHENNQVRTSLTRINAKFKFDDTKIQLVPVANTDQFRIVDFEFELELIEGSGNGDTYGLIKVKLCRGTDCNTTVTGTFEIQDDPNTNLDIKYTFEIIKRKEVVVIEGPFDDQVILRNYTSKDEFLTEVKAIILYLDYNFYLEELFSSTPTPNVFSALTSFQLAPPYDIKVRKFLTGSGSKAEPYLVVFAQDKINRSAFCDCGKPGGVTVETDIEHRTGEEGSATTIRRRLASRTRQVVSNRLKGRFVAGFLLPYRNPSNNQYRTFMKEFTSSTFLTTSAKDSGKTNGIKWDYKISASIPVSDIKITPGTNSDGSEYLLLEIPQQLKGRVKFKKEIGCGVSLKDQVKLTNGKIDPYNIKIEIKHVNGDKGSEIILLPETEARLYYRLKPSGIFAFLGLLLTPKIDRKVIEDEIIEKTNKQILSLIKGYAISTIPQKNVYAGATFKGDSMLLALSDYEQEG